MGNQVRSWSRFVTVCYYFLYFGYFFHDLNQLQFMIVKLIIILAFCIHAMSHTRQLQTIGQFSIEGNTNEQIEVSFPLDYVYAVKIKNESLPQYMKIIPKRFKLASKKQGSIESKNKKSLLQDLRAPFTNQYALMFLINQNIIIFEMPNTFIVFKENEDEFTKEREFKINGIIQHSRIYAIQDLFLIVAISTSEIVVINQNITAKQPNLFNTTQALIIKRVSFGNPNHFICILNNTLYFLQMNTKGMLTIIRNQSFIQKGTDIQISALQRGQQFKNNQQFWILDENKGLYVMVVSKLLEIVNFPTLIQKQIGCFEIDTDIQKHSIHLLLTCKIKGNNNFVYLTFDNDKKAYPFLLQREMPYDQKCNSDKYYFFKNYVISEQSESLGIFVPDYYVNNKIKYRKNWVTLEGINNFVLSRDEKRLSLVVYLAKNGMLQKKQLQFQKARLVVKSQNAVNQTVTLKLEYECNVELKKMNQVCQIETLLKINIHNNIVSYIQYKSVNIGLILLLSTVLIALIVICRYKYKSIYKNKYSDLKQLTNPQKCTF